MLLDDVVDGQTNRGTDVPDIGRLVGAVREHFLKHAKRLPWLRHDEQGLWECRPPCDCARARQFAPPSAGIPRRKAAVPEGTDRVFKQL